MGAANGAPGGPQQQPFAFGGGTQRVIFGQAAPPAPARTATNAAVQGNGTQAAPTRTGPDITATNMDLFGESAAPTVIPPGFGPPLAPECAQALPHVARALSDKHEAEQAIRGRIPGGLGDGHTFESSAVIARDINRLTLDTFKSMDPLHQPAPVSSVMFITPVTNRAAPHEVNPFIIAGGAKMPAALRLRDRLADLLLRADFSFLTQDGATRPVEAKDVFEDGLNSINLLIDDNRITGMFTLTVFPEFVDQLSTAFRGGRFGHFFCPARPREEPNDALHVAIAVEKMRGSTYCQASEVIYELWHQYKAKAVYFITDNRAFKGQFIYMVTCLNEDHRDWCLRNPITLLGDEQFDAFRHKPVKGLNYFFVHGAQSVTDADLRLKSDLAGFFHLPASEIKFVQVKDLVSPNVVILRGQTPDDAGSVALCSALMSRGVILSTAKPKTTIAYSKSHVGAAARGRWNRVRLGIAWGPLPGRPAEPSEWPGQPVGEATPQTKRVQLQGAREFPRADRPRLAQTIYRCRRREAAQFGSEGAGLS